MSMTNSVRCDVVVIGAGVAGMIAGTRLSQGAQRVLVLEKLSEERYVCNSRLTTGVWHCCATDILREPDLLESRIMEVTGSYAQPDLARAVARDGIRSVRWMQKAGVRFIKGPFDYQSFMLSPPSLTPQGRQWEGRGGDVMLRTLESELTRRGGRILRGHWALDLLKTGERIIGLTGQTEAGAPFTIHADAVVVADGGFQANEELTRGSISPKPEQVFQRNARTGTGDGLQMAREAGAAVSDLRGFYGHVLSRDVFRTDKLWPYPYLDHVVGAGIVVDKNCQRFADEGMGGVAMANAIAASEDPSDKIVIADDLIWKECGTHRLLSPNPTLPNNGGTMHSARSVEELAKLCDLDPERLVGLVQRYNAAVRAGETLGLVVPRSAAKHKPYPIEVAPFHAFPVCAGITYTMGGISINAAGQALTPQGAAVPGLYAVGCATGGLEGGPKSGYVGGLVKSSVTGLRAAEHILGELHGQDIQPSTRAQDTRI